MTDRPRGRIFQVMQAVPLVLVLAATQAPVSAPQVHQAFVRLAARPLWPQFEPARTPLAVYDGHDTWLFGHPSPPADFEAVAGCDACLRYDGWHADVRANTSVELGGVRTATLLVTGEEHRTADELAAVAVHEAFHVFQDEAHTGWTADEGALLTYPLDDAAGLAQRRLETEALRRALAAGTDAEAAAWCGAALEARRRRFKRLEEDSRAYERGIELREGLAQYVQHKALGRLSGPSLPGAGYAPDAVRARGYDTGEAMAVLLERLQPAWKSELVAGATLDALLSLAAESTGVAPAVLPTGEADSIAAAATRDLDDATARRRRVLQEFLDQPGWTLRIVVDAGAEPLWPFGFDPMNASVMPGGRVLHGRWFKLGNGAGRIEVLNRRALTVPAGEHPLFQGIREVLVTGLPARPEVFGDASRTWVAAEGVSAHFERATSETAEGRVVVHVKP